MKPKLLICLLFFSFILLKNGMAITIVVTSNADSGPGTLREAIATANANGTAVYDTIVFNIPDVSIAGRTITLQTTLPHLSSKIIIDGSSQPGTNIGISTAKVTLYLDHYTSVPFDFLFIENASEVSIFGIHFKYFDNPNNGGGQHYAITLRNASFIQIGKPGKGNLFSSVRLAISNNYWNYYTDSINDLSIQSNIIGMSSGGSNAGGGYTELIRARNIKVGGSQPDEGNIFLNAIQISQSQFPNPAYFVHFENNRFGYDGTSYYYNQAYISLYGNGIDDTTQIKTIIKNNIISAENWYTAIGISFTWHKVVIQGNQLGVDVGNPGGCHGTNNNIGIYQCKDVLIGGYLPQEQNIIAGDISAGSDRVNIIQNQFAGKIYNPGTPPLDPFIKILTYDNNLITGLANPNSKIQLYTNICQGPPCIKKNYLTTVWADASGNWQFPYTAAMPNIVATATRGDSSTSEFTEVNVDHFTSRLIKDATCGRSNGSITGIKIYAGTHFGWYNSYTQQLICTDTNLVNVPAGSYVFIVKNGENGCPWSVNFTINDLQPPPSINPSVTNASCGLFNGSIVTTAYGYGTKWMNNNSDSIGTGNFINNIGPGNYYLKVWVGSDTSCNRTFGPFAINNNSGPTLNTNSLQVVHATCGNSNGDITGITTTNVTGIPFIQWLDSLNNPVGSSLNLINIPAGKYKLKFKDQGGCDTIITPFYIIQSLGVINIDTSQLAVTSSECAYASGTITGLNVQGATSYQWINSAGQTTNNLLVPGFVYPGTYVLIATNQYGCTKKTDSIHVPTYPYMFFTNPLQIQGKPGRCDSLNGYVNLMNFPNPQNYTFRWIDSLHPNIIISTSLNLSGINSGTYILFAKNAAGCEQQVLRAHLPYQPSPVIAGAGIITDEVCNNRSGSIKGLAVSSGTGIAPFTYTWIDASNNIVSTQQNLTNVPEGNYTLVVKDNIGCRDTSNVLQIKNSIVQLNNPKYDDQYIRINTIATLTLLNPQQGNYLLFDSTVATVPIQQNNNGIFTTTALSADKTYYIQLVNGNCSSSKMTVKVYVYDKTNVFVPSGFTPNNDGKNDVLKVRAYGIVSLEYFSIYNKWGQLVFTTKDISKGWDGTMNGMTQSTSVFVWMVKAKDELTGEYIQKKGTVLLIR
jgi:gliding motility-associated-like protein